MFLNLSITALTAVKLVMGIMAAQKTADKAQLSTAVWIKLDCTVETTCLRAF